MCASNRHSGHSLHAEDQASIGPQFEILVFHHIADLHQISDICVNGRFHSRATINVETINNVCVCGIYRLWECGLTNFDRVQKLLGCGVKVHHVYAPLDDLAVFDYCTAVGGLGREGEKD